jgi:hypothetical protein
MLVKPQAELPSINKPLTIDGTVLAGLPQKVPRGPISDGFVRIETF